MLSRLIALTLVLALAAPLLAGCGGGEGETVALLLEEFISASEGGNISSSDGRITVEIPGGALSEDTEITVREMEEEEWSDDIKTLGPLGHVYSLEPDGLEFTQPVKLTLRLETEDLAGLDLEDGYPVFLPCTTTADGEWELLLNPSSEVDMNAGAVTVSGESSHFSNFTVVVDPELGLQIEFPADPVTTHSTGTWSAQLTVTNIGSEDILIEEIEYFGMPESKIVAVSKNEAMFWLSPKETRVFQPVYHCLGSCKGQYVACVKAEVRVEGEVKPPPDFGVTYHKWQSSRGIPLTYYDMMAVVTCEGAATPTPPPLSPPQTSPEPGEGLAGDDQIELHPLVSKLYNVADSDADHSGQEGTVSFWWKFQDDEGYPPSTQKFACVTPTVLPSEFQEQYDSGEAIVGRTEIDKKWDNLYIPFDEEGKISFSLRTQTPGEYGFKVCGILLEDYTDDGSYGGNGDELVVEVPGAAGIGELTTRYEVVLQPSSSSGNQRWCYRCEWELFAEGSDEIPWDEIRIPYTELTTSEGLEKNALFEIIIERSTATGEPLGENHYYAGIADYCVAEGGKCGYGEDGVLYWTTCVEPGETLTLTIGAVNEDYFTYTGNGDPIVITNPG